MNAWELQSQSQAVQGGSWTLWLTMYLMLQPGLQEPCLMGIAGTAALSRVLKCQSSPLGRINQRPPLEPQALSLHHSSQLRPTSAWAWPSASGGHQTPRGSARTNVYAGSRSPGPEYLLAPPLPGRCCSEGQLCFVPLPPGPVTSAPKQQENPESGTFSKNV